jgi:hypothetical protein
MDLKDFIKETVSAIVSATTELQQELALTGAIINPPTSGNTNMTFEKNSAFHTLRKVEIVDFDVAVTAKSETSGEAKAGVSILMVEIGGKADHGKATENASRVRFQIPIVLPPSPEEDENLAAKKRQDEKTGSQHTKRNIA